MLINKISTYFLITLLIVMSGVHVFAQVTSRHKVKKVDSGKGVSKEVSIDKDQESDTASIVSSFKNKGDAMQQAVIQRNLIGDTLHKIKSGDDFWYANAKTIKKGSQETKFSFLRWLVKALSGTTARFVIWCILIGGMVFFFVFYLMNNEIGLFAPAKRKMVEIRHTDGLADDIFEIDFETALAGSLATRDYRLSIRLLFLRLLKTMNERKVIEYSIDRTNFDYLFQLNGTDYFNSFSTLIKSYEYTWYGEFAVSEKQYALIEKNFSQFQQQINHRY
jgi:hypothetical protein